MGTIAETLRGTLKEKTVDARRIMQAAKNPACALSRAAMLAGIDMAEMVLTAFREPLDNTHQSPFAIRQGNAFERRLSDNGAARLIDALVQKGFLGKTETRVRHLGDGKDLRSSNQAVRMAAIRHAIAETDRELRRKAVSDPAAYNVLLQAHLPIRLADDGVIAILRADALIAPDASRSYMIGEIKSFPALHHNTDGRDVEAAAAQAGVYTVALEERLRRLGLAVAVPTSGILILRSVTGLLAEPTLQTIDRDIDFARRMLAQRPRTLQEVAAILGPGEGLDKAANILKLPRNFTGACRSFCPMTRVCHNLAVQEHSAAAVSDGLREIIGGMKTDRAVALLRGALPADAEEAEVQQRLISVHKSLQKAS
jgi:hypothetical protein